MLRLCQDVHWLKIKFAPCMLLPEIWIWLTFWANMFFTTATDNVAVISKFGKQSPQVFLNWWMLWYCRHCMVLSRPTYISSRPCSWIINPELSAFISLWRTVSLESRRYCKMYVWMYVWDAARQRTPEISLLITLHRHTVWPCLTPLREDAHLWPLSHM